MREQWETILEFPNYEVSDYGNVINTHSGHLIRPSKNQHGVMNVGMMKHGIQCKRSVPLLVANAFVRRPDDPRFNTVMHLDGNREHNFAANLVWRPRPFIHLYYSQFRNHYQNRINVPIINATTEEVFENSFDAATHYGVLEKAVVFSILNDDEPVFPIGDKFDVV